MLRPICDDLAAQGFLAIGPAREGAAAADVTRSLHAASRLLDTARALPEANGRVSLLAFGRDGMLAFGLATRCTCDATVVYGADQLARLAAEGLCLRGPVLLHLHLQPGDEGSASHNADLAALERNPLIELHLYGGAEAAAEAALARGRSLRFLRQTLGG
ncbi:hypothetical protein ACPOLB_25140 [Rubrivivax sp. RP6-9]|uniref:hypothetical protein n=1 Tax=Rubrivivax sp. RP6-9 TaxID=3415750 RepID=UPI003CC51D65